MDDSPIYRLPPDVFHMIFLSLPLRQIIICRSVSKPFHQLLTSPSFLSLVSSHSPHRLIFLRPPHHHRSHHDQSLSTYESPTSSLFVFDIFANFWLQFDLSYLPFSALSLITSTLGLVYLLANSPSFPESQTSLLVCNPLTRSYRVLPQIKPSWSRHGFVYSASGNCIVVITKLVTFYLNGLGSVSKSWMKLSSNLPSKPRSPLIVAHSLYALCDLGTPKNSVWKLFTCDLPVPEVKTAALWWSRVEIKEWGDVFGILELPSLVKGRGNNVLVVGRLKSSFKLNKGGSRILILRLDLETLKWDEAGRMPVDMCDCFQMSSEFKVFGFGDKVCFSAKRAGKLVLWDCGDWRWIHGPPGFGDAMYRSFMFDARPDPIP